MISYMQIPNEYFAGRIRQVDNAPVDIISLGLDIISQNVLSHQDLHFLNIILYQIVLNLTHRHSKLKSRYDSSK